MQVSATGNYSFNFSHIATSAQRNRPVSTDAVTREVPAGLDNLTGLQKAFSSALRVTETIEQQALLDFIR